MEIPIPKPPNLGCALGVLVLFSTFYFFTIFFVYPADSMWRILISINYLMSLVGFFILVWCLLPLRSRYGRHVPIGLVIGTVYLGIVVLFMFYNIPTDTNWLRRPQMELFAIGVAIYMGFLFLVTSDSLTRKLVLSGIIPPFVHFVLMSNFLRNPTFVPMIYDCAGDLYSVTEWIPRWMYNMSIVIFLFVCLNGVNVFGGISGLEFGQSVVVSAFMIIFNVMGISNSTDAEYNLNHMISTFLLLPFLICSFSLLAFRYPCSVFVNDSFPPFAGTVVFVAGLVGQFRETIVIFLIPQILNFLFFFPQLFNLYEEDMVAFPRFDPITRKLVETNDMTLINLFLRLFGPCSEKSMYIKLIIFQVLSCSLGIGLYAIFDA